MAKKRADLAEYVKVAKVLAKASGMSFLMSLYIILDVAYKKNRL